MLGDATLATRLCILQSISHAGLPAKSGALPACDEVKGNISDKS